MSETIVYSTEVTAHGGRDGGHAESKDGNLTVNLSMPKEFGGPGGTGTNPEQMFGAAFASCFLSATKLVARLNKVTLPEDISVTSKIGVYRDGIGFALTVELLISLPGIEREVGEKLIAGAHERCPFSRATRGNVDVKLTLL
jgi:Ohr subfamily peroxiredoxin